ncbi:hypothetical protein [Polaromonas sp. SM01]|uniref:hypothetical protein n=1 Tax=Polaromonas sp. SM01 TaxID=3085630 RepID=UPI002981AB15|nr:hypothetical protein [Polaromonas sp. SM01]MDW5444218.1 hypothetical protein [Polaromonas sp. SM01]
MQIIRTCLLVLLLGCTTLSMAQVQQARGKATVPYSGRSATPDIKAKANLAAQLKAVEFYYAEAGESEAANFDAVRDKIIADPDRYILETTVLAEEDSADKKQYTVAVKVSLNVANLRNAVKANSAVAKTGRADKSPLAFLFISRQVDSVKAYDARVFKRVDESVKVNRSGATSNTGVEGESVGRSQVKTNSATTAQESAEANRTRTREIGGSTVRKSSESTWRLIPSANLNQVFLSTFSRAGFKVSEAALVEPYTGGQFKVSAVEDDYKSGNDMTAATLQSVVKGMRTAQIPYVALGTLDVGMAEADPSTGLARVSVTVNAKIYDLTQTIPDTIASVGPVQYAGVGPTEDEARTNALKLAANNAARELTSQVTNLGVR